MFQQDDVLTRCYTRLRYLQDLYFDGNASYGSPEYFEMLVLEEMEWRFVQEGMERLYGINRKPADRADAAATRRHAGEQA